MNPLEGEHDSAETATVHKQNQVNGQRDSCGTPERSTRGSHAGAHQFHSPSSSISDGTSRARIRL